MDDNEIDGTKFLSSFSHILAGERVAEGPWEEGPCGSVSKETDDTKRLIIAEEWAQLVHKRSKVIPRLAMKGRGRVENIVRQGGLRHNALSKKGPYRKEKDNTRKSTCKFCGQRGLRAPRK